MHDTRRERLLDTFLAREAGRPLRGGTDALPPDYVDGATISARAMRAAVVATARLVLRARGAGGMVSVPTLDAESFSLKSWNELVADGRRRAATGDIGRGRDGARAGGRFRRSCSMGRSASRRSLYRVHDRLCSRRAPSAAICSVCRDSKNTCA